MFIYNDLAFRVIEKDDLEILRNLHNDPNTWINLYNIDFVDEIAQVEWWKSLHSKQNDRRFVICFSADLKKILGRLRIQNINWNHCNCEVGLDILPQYRGKGYGQKSYMMLLSFLFHHLNMNMVYVKVGDFNPHAKKLYLKIGFKETGKLTEYYYRHGKYWDYIIMCITKNDFSDPKKEK